MLNTTAEYLNSFKTAARHIAGSIKYVHSGVEYELPASGGLKSFTIEKTSPQGKLFGFAVSQKITIEALGVYENIQKGDKLIPSVGIKDATNNVELPNFYVDTVEFNKVNNTTTIIGYDLLHSSNNFIVNDIDFTYPISLENYAIRTINFLGGSATFEGYFYTIDTPPNYEGTEKLHTVLNHIAEASGTVCYVSQNDQVRFRKLNGNTPIDTLTVSDYYNLSFGEEITLNKIAHATNLGDNLYAGSDGFTQVLWENPFLSARADVGTILSMLFVAVNGSKNVAYNLDWRGCPAYEIGDCITLQEKDGTEKIVHYLNETLTYNGGLRAVSNWETIESERVDASPASIGKTIKQTYARVDKLNQEIELLASRIEDSDVGHLQEEIASIKLTTDAITQEVSRVETTTENAIEVLASQVSNTMTADDITILIENQIGDGITSVITETGYIFDKDGLTISKSGSEMTTQITDDGMTVSRNGTIVLTADNIGVDAINLHATTYLLIGETSRFEDYYDTSAGQRTGCFWLG